MTVSTGKFLPSYQPENYADVVDLPVSQPREILILEKEYLQLKSEVGYWQAMHKKAVLRKDELKQTVKEQEGKIRDLRNRLFGKKTEKGGADKNEGKKEPSTPKRPCGQQPGSKGHGRTKRPDLPQREETVNLPETPTCSKCGKHYITDESKEAEIIEVEVKVYTRKIIRCCTSVPVLSFQALVPVCCGSSNNPPRNQGNLRSFRSIAVPGHRIVQGPTLQALRSSPLTSRS